MVKFGKIEWIASAFCTGYVAYTLYNLGNMVRVNVPYFAEIASSSDVDMKRWMYTTSAEIIVFAIAALVLGLFLIMSFKEVWMTKKVKEETEKKEKVKGRTRKEIEPEIIRFD